MAKLMILRHAPAITGGTLAGRLDVPADCSDGAAFEWIRDRIGQPDRVLASPARRCAQTVAALGLSAQTCPTLWEQDYGDWEGKPYDALPDLGRLMPADLARHRPRNGESFEDMTARVLPQLQAIRSDTLIVAHAGTARAALSLVTGPAALSFTIAPLSLTILRRAGEDWAVEAVNITAP